MINPWSALNTTVVAGNPATYTYTVNHNTINVFVGDAVGGALAGTTLNDFNNGSALALPGRYSFQTSRHGVTNQNVAGTLPAPAGLNQRGAYWPVIDQRNNDNAQWIVFRPDDEMKNHTGDDAMVISWKTSRPAHNQAAGAQVSTGKGNACLHVTGVAARNQVIQQTLPAHPDLRWDADTRTSWPLYDIRLHDTHTHAFDYTLKALYEYGNCQYQFTSDGAPTRVLPNLVPVRDSSAIPIV
jgi:hypothetical protein